jgi:hypothetical protein
VTEQPLTRPGPQVHAASLTAATTGLAVWSVQTYLFHGNEIPGPLYGFLQLAVPALCGRLGAEVAYRRARRQLDTPQHG